MIFGYLVDRSMDHVVPYVSLPALLIGTLWLSLVLRSAPRPAAGGRAGALAFALSVALLLVAVAWSSIGPRLEHSALAHVVPGGASTRAALDRLWDFPPFKPTAPAGERLLERYMPGERQSLVLAEPDLATEILVTERALEPAADRLSVGGHVRGKGATFPVFVMRWRAFVRASGCYSTRRARRAGQDQDGPGIRPGGESGGGHEAHVVDHGSRAGLRAREDQ